MAFCFMSWIVASASTVNARPFHSINARFRVASPRSTPRTAVVGICKTDATFRVVHRSAVTISPPDVSPLISTKPFICTGIPDRPARPENATDLSWMLMLASMLVASGIFVSGRRILVPATRTSPERVTFVSVATMLMSAVPRPPAIRMEFFGSAARGIQ